MVLTNGPESFRISVHVKKKKAVKGKSKGKSGIPERK